MDRDRVSAANEIITKIEHCETLLNQIAFAAKAPVVTNVIDDKGAQVFNEDGSETQTTTYVGCVIRSAVVSRPDGGHTQTLVFPDELAITADETNVIGQALANIVMARLTALQATLAAL